VDRRDLERRVLFLQEEKAEALKEIVEAKAAIAKVKAESAKQIDGLTVRILN
jgi:hypothetical protein